jgi:2-(1,2-epoxy-1,2-dihydrophenyl)acetyl-CoA isomerase
MLTRAPLSYGVAKRLLTAAADIDTRTAILAESLAQSALLQTEDHREGLAAARDRHDPTFNAR